jgi:hypothetical protein
MNIEWLFVYMHFNVRTIASIRSIVVRQQQLHTWAASFLFRLEIISIMKNIIDCCLGWYGLLWSCTYCSWSWNICILCIENLLNYSCCTITTGWHIHVQWTCVLLCIQRITWYYCCLEWTCEKWEGNSNGY